MRDNVQDVGRTGSDGEYVNCKSFLEERPISNIRNERCNDEYDIVPFLNVQDKTKYLKKQQSMIIVTNKVTLPKYHQQTYKHER